MNDWWYVLIFAAAYAWPRLVGHELSHAVACIVTGGSVDWSAFRPWPHKAPRADGKTRWLWGSMCRSGGDELWILIAPAGKATALAVIWTVLGAWLWLPLLVCAGWELTDVIHWVRGWYTQPYSDGGRTRALLAAQKKES